MDWQLIVVSLSIAAAGTYLGRQTWRTWFGRKSGSCGGGCSCKSSESTNANSRAGQALIDESELTARIRNGN